MYPLPLRLVRPTGLDLLYFDMEIRGLTQDERCGAGYDKPIGHRHEKQRRYVVLSSEDLTSNQTSDFQPMGSDPFGGVTYQISYI